MEYDIEINNYGDIIYYKKGTKIHHRENGPAVEMKSGKKYWAINQQFHRSDGPAIEHENGDKSWYFHGQAHRMDGPALDWKEKKVWFINGKIHRENAPAVENSNGTKEWWINGERLSPEKETILNKWWDNKNGI